MHARPPPDTTRPRRVHSANRRGHTVKQRILIALQIAAVIALGILLWRGTSHGAPPCTGCDCTTPVDRPCPQGTPLP